MLCLLTHSSDNELARTSYSPLAARPTSANLGQCVTASRAASGMRLHYLSNLSMFGATAGLSRLSKRASALNRASLAYHVVVIARSHLDAEL